MISLIVVLYEYKYQFRSIDRIRHAQRVAATERMSF